MPSLRTILRRIENELKDKEKVMKATQEDMRKATSLSKQAILLIHQKKMKDAEKLIQNAGRIISKVNTISAQYPGIVFSGMLSAALQEYSEANIFLKLIQELRFVTPEEISVPSVDYVLGLADVIGEYRRRALDALREGDLKKSEKCLETMDAIYMELTAMDESYMLVGGLRRKCDVARKITEITRGDVTQEIRRNLLEKHLKRFEKLAVKKRQHS